MSNHFKVINLKKILKIVLAVAIPLAVGGLSALLTKNSMIFYAALQKPPLAPPGFLFPIIWTILFILIGLASYLVARRGTNKPYVRDALYFYAASLAINFLWPIVFFRFQAPFAAFWVLLLLWLITGIAVAKFYRISHAAGYLMLPYWLWITFAGYLNLAVWLLNR